MEFKSGDRVQVGSESTERPPGRASSRRSCKGRLTLAIASAGTTGTRASTHPRPARCKLPSRPRRRKTEATGRRADTRKRSPA